MAWPVRPHSGQGRESQAALREGRAVGGARGRGRLEGPLGGGGTLVEAPRTPLAELGLHLNNPVIGCNAGAVLRLVGTV